MVKSPPSTSASKASKTSTTTKPPTTKTPARTSQRKQTKQDKPKPKNLGMEISAEATKDVTMVDMTGNEENVQNTLNISSQNQLPETHQTNNQQDDTSQTSTKSDDTNKMTNTNTSTTSPNNPFQALDPNARTFTPNSQSDKTKKVQEPKVMEKKINKLLNATLIAYTPSNFPPLTIKMQLKK